MKTDKNPQRCETCKFFGVRREWGRCKRRAPIAVAGIHHPVWPSVDKNGCCGDWQLGRNLEINLRLIGGEFDGAEVSIDVAHNYFGIRIGEINHHFTLDSISNPERRDQTMVFRFNEPVEDQEKK